MKRLWFLLLLICPSICFAGQGMGPGPGFVVASACTSQTITWNTQPAAMEVGDADQTLNMATASSSLTVSYTSTTTSVCTVVDGKIHAVSAGNCVIQADQAGDATYCAATHVDSGNVEITGTAIVNYCTDANAQLCLYMNGNGTDETDRTANGYTITDSATSPATSADVPDGYTGTSRLFIAASTELLECAEANCSMLDINGADATFTIPLWVKFNSIPANSVNMSVIQKYATSSAQRQYKVYIVGTGSSQFKFALAVSADSTTGASAEVFYSDTTTYVANTWYHLAIVSNDTDIRMYVTTENQAGASLATASPTAKVDGIFNGSAPMTIGAATNSGNTYVEYLDGYLDEVAIFDRALSADEIDDIYLYGLTGNNGGSD